MDISEISWCIVTELINEIADQVCWCFQSGVYSGKSKFIIKKCKYVTGMCPSCQQISKVILNIVRTHLKNKGVELPKIGGKDVLE